MPNSTKLFLCGVLGVCLFWAHGSSRTVRLTPTASPIDQSAEVLLAKAHTAYLTQIGIRSIEYHQLSRTDFLERLHPNAQNITSDVVEGQFRFDGDKYDIETRYWTIRNKTERVPQYDARSIWDGKLCVTRSEHAGRAPPPPPEGSLWSTAPTLEDTGRPNFYGRQPTELQPILERLYAARAGALRPTDENVDGHRCRVIDAKLPDGDYTVWIDPSADYQLRRATVLSRADHPAMMQQAGKDFLKCETEVRDVQIEKVGTYWMPTHLVLQTRAYMDVDGKTAIEDSVRLLTRTQVRLDPDYAKEDAFKMDGLIDGTRLRFNSDDPMYGVEMIWRDGRPQTDPKHATPTPRPQLSHPAIGQAAPDIEGKDVNGAPIRLSNYRGKCVTLVFWGPWHRPCIDGISKQRDLARSMKDEPFVLLGVIDDDEVGRAKEIIEQQQISWPNFYDGEHGPIVRRWGVDSYPTYYLIDAKGVLRAGPFDRLCPPTTAMLNEAKAPNAKN